MGRRPADQEPVPARQEHRSDSHGARPASTSDGWSDSESRAWGGPSSQPTGEQPAAGDGSIVTDEKAGRPRRQRPLRGGGRSS